MRWQLFLLKTGALCLVSFLSLSGLAFPSGAANLKSEEINAEEKLKFSTSEEIAAYLTKKFGYKWKVKGKGDQIAAILEGKYATNVDFDDSDSVAEATGELAKVVSQIAGVPMADIQPPPEIAKRHQLGWNGSLISRRYLQIYNGLYVEAGQILVCIYKHYDKDEPVRAHKAIIYNSMAPIGNFSTIPAIDEEDAEKLFRAEFKRLCEESRPDHSYDRLKEEVKTPERVSLIITAVKKGSFMEKRLAYRAFVGNSKIVLDANTGEILFSKIIGVVY